MPERRRTSVRANHALRVRKPGAIRAQRPSAIGANGDSFGMMRGTFHVWPDRRWEAALRTAEMQIRNFCVADSCIVWPAARGLAGKLAMEIRSADSLIRARLIRPQPRNFVAVGDSRTRRFALRVIGQPCSQVAPADLIRAETAIPAICLAGNSSTFFEGKFSPCRPPNPRPSVRWQRLRWFCRS